MRRSPFTYPPHVWHAARAAILGLIVLLVGMAPAWAACYGPVADLAPKRIGFTPVSLKLAARDGGKVGLTFIGHASFLIESPAGVAAVTDYNDYLRAPFAPDIVTMNLAHSTHYSNNVEPGVKLVLRGWDPAGGVANHDVTLQDMRVRNIPTNIREGDGARMAGNSIFVFDVAGLCIVHLGHLHHTLTPAHLADLGQVDVLLVPIDGTWTLSQDDMMQVIRDVKAPLVIPMHYFSKSILDRFLARVGDSYTVTISRVAAIDLSRETLPERPEILVLPGN